MLMVFFVVYMGSVDGTTPLTTVIAECRFSQMAVRIFCEILIYYRLGLTVNYERGHNRNNR